MIEEFSFGNSFSFKDIQTLNMTAAKIKSNNSILDQQNVIPIKEELSLLKSKAIYGANASGKSNVIKGLVTFIRIIKDSVKEEKSLTLIDSFQLSTETIDEPTFFQLIFRVDNVVLKLMKRPLKVNDFFQLQISENKICLLEKTTKF
ncbi:AAA family ATPase [Flavobacterium sp. ZS1P14]|uniref:AAA family ATPase n=1 Tax=Flavobacterium sp. ZS1P14 TaxID=3401729 RepID=UPI003AAA31D5